MKKAISIRLSDATIKDLELLATKQFLGKVSDRRGNRASAIRYLMWLGFKQLGPKWRSSQNRVYLPY